MAAYDHVVFLSFGTEDNHGFPALLYDALERAGIHTLRGHPLLAQIRRSRFAIIIFSEDYASSKLCLRELEEIMTCHETQAQLVLPIFYNVFPSVVEHQTGSYGTAMALHEQSIWWRDLVLPWRQALTEAANLQPRFNRADFVNESLLMRQIVAHVAMEAYDYDVFLSYRDADSHSFSNNLIQALPAEIRTFVAANEEEPSLAQIQRSRMAIIVFSQDYAFSTSRLRELVRIMECHRTQGQQVMPLFCREVSLSDVSRPSGRYGEAMTSHEGNLINGDQVLQWRDKLTAAARGYTDGTRGFVKVNVPYYRTEGELITRIVSDVNQRLRLVD